MNKPDLLIRAMRRDELDVLVDWAAGEGWNPGLHDAEIFWATDPGGFVAAELGGELIGGGSIVSYDGLYGFMGFFIIHPDHRGRGLGNTLWNERLKRLVARLQKPAVIGMDGVFAMQDYYARGGFRFHGRDLRYRHCASPGELQNGIVPLGELPFEVVNAFDRAHFPAPRADFLRRWISAPGSFSLGLMDGQKLSGFGVVRPCRSGYKIGPLFAEGGSAAETLFEALCGCIPGEEVFLDVPENNKAAMALAARWGMEEVFGCAKMYYGPAPDLPIDEIFGVTTFELG